MNRMWILLARTVWVALFIYAWCFAAVADGGWR